ncbi:hypothetical protein KL86APRO_12560 [uncultured Alphaproteobacteria bacterium]|uniref:HTH cro/C1-type domain-containing protein n=1 Tax=uncultured Alphaproteobacteria bacterium TaxID=91750 RepID=A0A212KCF2_9PROT|nr:hypothetical protein KL86APRO_12560 [uncultured Alphaproteobacteria bacterium]
MTEDLKPDDGFAERLRLAMGGETESAFAARCPDISRPLLRKYLAGSEPGLSKVVLLAAALGVSVEWLATGRGPMHPSGTPSGADVIDEELLGRVASRISEVYREENARIQPLQLVQMASRWYGDLIRHFAPEEREAGLKGMVIGLRRELRNPRDTGSASGKLLA